MQQRVCVVLSKEKKVLKLGGGGIDDKGAQNPSLCIEKKEKKDYRVFF